MKYLTIFVLSLAMISCEKKESLNGNSTAKVENSKEESLTQEAKILTNGIGEKITITYFAQGGEVAVRLKKENEKEHTLAAKGTSEKGNPIFTDETYMWEMSEDGVSGTLSDKANNKSVYK